MNLKIIGFLICLATLLSIDIVAVHEAYLPAIVDCLPLKPIKHQPPQPKKEECGQPTDPNMIWISGYWQWNKNKEEFDWISGVWRKPPNGHQWIPGYWHAHKKHWVYVQGFWSKIPVHELVYLPLPPLDAEDERCECPGSDYCWAPGYWLYATDLKDYHWICGEWVPYNKERVYVPTYYHWYKKGYVCTEAFWDWSFAERSDQDLCHDLAYDLIYCYPDYLYFYQYYVQTYPSFLTTCKACPQWFNQPDWWTYSWRDHWHSWWWYTHENYIQPQWFNNCLTDLIGFPCFSLASQMEKIDCPLFIGDLTPCSYDSLYECCEWDNFCSYPPIFFNGQGSKRRGHRSKQSCRSYAYKKNENFCQTEAFWLQWDYFCRRFYYRRLGLWYHLCGSCGCFTTRLCEVNPIDSFDTYSKQDQKREFISDLTLEKESQRVERARFLSLLTLYGPTLGK